MVLRLTGSVMTELSSATLVVVVVFDVMAKLLDLETKLAGKMLVPLAARVVMILTGMVVVRLGRAAVKGTAVLGLAGLKVVQLPGLICRTMPDLFG